MPGHLPSLGRLGSTHSEGKMNFHLKIVVLGSPRVGKTAIVSQFLYSHFPETYNATVDELHRAEYEIKGFGDLVLDILDTSGSHEFPAMKKLAIESGDAFLLVFSLTDPNSFEEVRQLREEIIETKTCAAKAKAEAAAAAAAKSVHSPIYNPQQQHSGYTFGNSHHHDYDHTFSYTNNNMNRGRHHSINPIIASYQGTHHYPPSDRLDNQFNNSLDTNKNNNSLISGIDSIDINNNNLGAGGGGGSGIGGGNGTGSGNRDKVNPLYDSGYIEPIKSPPIVVAGNKSDLDSMRLIKKELAETIVNIDWENGYVESSAKDDYNINSIFQQLMVQIGVPYKIGHVIGNPKIRRKSLPAYPTSPAIRDRVTPKRNSCAVS